MSSRTGSGSCEWSATKCSGGTQTEHGVAHTSWSSRVTSQPMPVVEMNVAWAEPGGGCGGCGGSCGCCTAAGGVAPGALLGASEPAGCARADVLNRQANAI